MAHGKYHRHSKAAAAAAIYAPHSEKPDLGSRLGARSRSRVIPRRWERGGTLNTQVAGTQRHVFDDVTDPAMPP